MIFAIKIKVMMKYTPGAPKDRVQRKDFPDEFEEMASRAVAGA